MIPRTLVPVSIFVAGIACIAMAVATGEAEVNLVLIFPVFSGSSGLFLLGVVLIIVSFLVGFAMLAMTQAEVSRQNAGALREIPEHGTGTRTEYGGVIMVGPVPIAFGSNKKIATIMLVLGVAAVLVLVGLILLLA